MSPIMNPDMNHADMSKIQAIQQKRTLAFVNHFVMTNVQFLNNFTRNCEQKLMDFERKLEKVNAAMVLLEARLSSIPELSTPVLVSEATAAPQTTESVVPPPPPLPDIPQHVESEDKPDSVSRPEYDKFVKMVQVGVPIQAVKLKVSLEGLDPNVLDEILHK